MISPPDPFSSTFDSIPVEPRAADLIGLAAAETAQPAPAKLSGEQPGFYLLDDANGRFTIDRDTGIVTLQHDHLLAIESGAVHPVHIRVVEFSGASYELKFRLRMTGRVPQIAGAEENDALAGLVASSPLIDLMTPEEKYTASEPPAIPWTQFSVVQLAAARRNPLYGETAPFGTLLASPASYPATYTESGRLTLEAAPPAPGAATAQWAL